MLKLPIVFYVASFVTFFVSYKTEFYGFSFLVFILAFILNQRYDDEPTNSHFENILTHNMIFVVLSFLSAGWMFYFLVAYITIKFWSGIYHALRNEVVVFNWFFV